MARRLKKINKIAKIRTSDLPIKHKANEPPIHYVYVENYDIQKRVYGIRVCTSLGKLRNGNLEVDNKKLKHVALGNTYPIPVNKSSFPKWTGIKQDKYKVPAGKLYDFNCFKIQKKHLKNFDKFYK